MKTTIKKWGNSLGIRIPNLMAKDLALKNGSTVEVIEEDHKIIIKATKKKTLNEILSLITKDNIHSSYFDGTHGKEIL